ncbi:MAG: hypothetical protein J6330_08185 [Clostridia bacterium]|nr:hypothetical protein [Clostridia bacterium]
MKSELCPGEIVRFTHDEIKSAGRTDLTAPKKENRFRGFSFLVRETGLVLEFCKASAQLFKGGFAKLFGHR